MVIWITGLSGAGKTTLGQALYSKLVARYPHIFVLDGDQVREAFDDDLGYTESDRELSFRRIARLAKLLSGQGAIVLVAALYSNPECLAWNRAHLKPYYEVYLDAPWDLLVARDSKGFYNRALRGDIKDVVGVDIDWNEPQQPDLRIKMDFKISSERLAEQVLQGCALLGGSTKPQLESAWPL